MRDSNGILYKIGESMQGVNKVGQSKRAEAQARKLYGQTGIEHKTEIRRLFDTKLAAREYGKYSVNPVVKNKTTL